MLLVRIRTFLYHFLPLDPYHPDTPYVPE